MHTAIIPVSPEQLVFFFVIVDHQNENKHNEQTPYLVLVTNFDTYHSVYDNCQRYATLATVNVKWSSKPKYTIYCQLKTKVTKNVTKHSMPLFILSIITQFESDKSWR